MIIGSGRGRIFRIGAEFMAGSTYQIQVRHIVVGEKEVAELLLETINAAPSGTARVKLFMKLAEKYSQCPSRVDGGNLGWLELEWNMTDPRMPRGGFKKLENEELYEFIKENADKKTMDPKIASGPVKTHEGYHVVIIANKIKTERIL